MLRLRAKHSQTLDAVKQFCDAKGITYGDLIYKDTLPVNFNSEGKLREELQEYFDERNWDLYKNWLLIEGNTLYSLKQIEKDVKGVKKSGNTDKISKRFYDFMYGNFTIAHYNIHGWKDNYPTWQEVKDVVIGKGVPAWYTDLQKIVDTCFK